jgi:hypothetical protein
MDKLRRIDLTMLQYANLVEFMNRVNMQGPETKAYIELMQLIENAIEYTKQDEEKIEEARK